MNFKLLYCLVAGVLLLSGQIFGSLRKRIERTYQFPRKREQLVRTTGRNVLAEKNDNTRRHDSQKRRQRR